MVWFLVIAEWSIERIVVVQRMRLRWVGAEQVDGEDDPAFVGGLQYVGLAAEGDSTGMAFGTVSRPGFPSIQR